MRRSRGKLTRFGVSMEAPLLERFDRAIRGKGYRTRSEAIRDIARNYLVGEEWAGDEREVAGTITLVYGQHVHGLADVLTAMQHEHHRLVLSATHIHLDRDNCLEVLVVRGAALEAKRLADRLISLKGVKHGRLTMTSTGRELA